MRRTNISELKELAQINGGKCISDFYKGSREKLEWECRVGHSWQEIPERMKYLSQNGRWCLQCEKIGRKADKLGKIKKCAVDHKIVCLSNEYIDANQKLKWICKKCAYEFSTRWSHFFKNKTKCPRCAGKAKRGIEDAQRVASLRGGVCLSENYKDCMTPLTWQCKKKHIWEARLDSVLNSGSWCFKCFTDELFRNPKWRPGVSKAQRKLHDILGGELNYPVKRFFVDIAFTDRKTCIEYDGSGHDLSVKIGRQTKEEFEQYEKRRTSIICDNGWKIIRLISKTDSLPCGLEIKAIVKSAELSNEDCIAIDLDKL